MKRSTIKRKTTLKPKAKTPEQIEIDKQATEAQWKLFHEVWAERGPYSEISGQYLGSECKSIYCHHILEKRNYEEAILDPENIIVLAWDEHQAVENNPSKYTEINERRKKLLVKYGYSEN